MAPELTYLLGVLAVAVAAVLVGAWLAAGRLVRRRAPDPTCTPEDFDLPFKHVTFTARDGVELGGRLTGEPGRPRPTVIFCAGLFGSMDGDTHMLPMFYEAGLDVLQFDWRAHGVSDGQRVTLGVHEVDDLRGALDFLQARGVRRIGLMGFSMGGAVALRAAAHDRRALCVVSDGGFAHVSRALEGFFRQKVGAPLRPLAWLVLRLAELRLGGVRLADASPVPHLAEIGPRPVLFIHGADDPFVPPEDRAEMLAAAGQPKALWIVEGAGHREAYDREPDAYRERVPGFFRAALMG